jgi:hypothetical protein
VEAREANSPSNLPSSEAPLTRRSSAPAEASAEFFAGVAVDDEARPRQHLEHRGERGVAHPVVRPGEPRSHVSTVVGLNAKRRSKRAPNSLLVSVAVRPLKASAKPPPLVSVSL